jgi:hypothetical protein
VNANETEIGTGKEEENEIGRGRGIGKERPGHLCPFNWVLVQPPFLMTSVIAIVWKERRTIATETAIVTVQGLAHIPLRSLPLRPPFPQFVNVNPVRVRQ